MSLNFSYENLYRHYLACRKTKRNTYNALRFEVNQERELLDLQASLINRTYQPKPSVCFVTKRPKLREIFAADFRDRVVHHVAVGYLEKIWEPLFIHDSYACRQGKGVHAGVMRLQKFIRQVSCNGQRRAWYLQLDIRNYFMRIDKELSQERERLDKERTHILNAISALKKSGESDSDLEQRLEAIDEAIAENDYRLANVRAGYVYIISNRGAFGDNIVKIGLTRRLEPLDRINELSGASVPFRFDIHALYFSEDAVTLENELHKHFADRAVNMANNRKEFFFVKSSEVKSVLLKKVGNLLEFTEDAEATEFLQSVKYWPEFSDTLGPKAPNGN